MQGIDPAPSWRDRRAQQRPGRRDLLVSSAAATLIPQQSFPAFNDAVALLVARWKRGDCSDAAYAALYFLHWEIDLHGTRFASRRYKDDARPEGRHWLHEAEQLSGAALDAQLQRWLERYQFRNVIPNVGVALRHWLNGQWPLRLLQHIPSPQEVLRMQTQGLRPVTLISEYPRLLRPVLAKPNGFVFMVHDLEHAWKFFHDPRLFIMQRGLFAALEGACADGIFSGELADAEFAERFDYLISDMNTHPVHSLQYLRAILVEHYLRSGVGELSLAARASVAQKLCAIGAHAAAAGDVATAFEHIGLGVSCDEDARVIERHLTDAVNK